jgi:hypothetical protein
MMPFDVSCPLLVPIEHLYGLRFDVSADGLHVCEGNMADKHGVSSKRAPLRVVNVVNIVNVHERC